MSGGATAGHLCDELRERWGDRWALLLGFHVKTICLNFVQDMHACCNIVSGGATAGYMRNDCMQAMGTLATVLQHDGASEP